MFREFIERAPGRLPVNRQIFRLHCILNRREANRPIQNGPEQGCQRHQGKHNRRDKQQAHQFAAQVAGNHVAVQIGPVGERGLLLAVIRSEIPERHQSPDPAQKAANDADPVAKEEPEQYSGEPCSGKSGKQTRYHTQFGVMAPAGGDGWSGQAAIYPQQQAEKENAKQRNRTCHINRKPRGSEQQRHG